jgi:glycogen operon protein
MTGGMDVFPGNPTKLGATWDGRGTNFAVYSQHATRVELCLFDGGPGGAERLRLPMRWHRGPIWHCYLPDVGPGTRYGYRVDGPYRPHEGHRFNPAKLLLDPYAKAISGSIDWDAPVFGFRRERRATELKIDGRDDASGKPRSVVIDPSFDWGNERRPATPWADTIIYEVHVKGFTALHPDIPEADRGTYRGFAHPAAIEHLTKLGITAVELLPVHAFIDDDFLARRGLRNYWGYKTIGFFAPEARYSASGDGGEQVAEFKAMVKALHAAGIEVILDVVYNHTAEGGNLGPTLSFRGLDNAVYYRLFAPERNFYEDVTGTGNTMNAQHPQVLKLIMDSLRYWVEEMRIDGFRFDLAPALSREHGLFSPKSAFLRAVCQDPVLSSVKLIAEPWDLGPGGYRLGGFPPGWSEWNDKFRDAARRFWRGDPGMARELATRMAGSADIFAAQQRKPTASVNFVTAHDGFTLRDLVSYERKHNLANGELNRDGSDHNSSWNNGVEGETNDPTIVERRQRAARNLLATLFLSQGAPMLLGGDERGRTQAGNNNAYCQDNELSWLSWDKSEELTAFVRRLIELRRESAVLRQAEFPTEITWLGSDGLPISLDQLGAEDRGLAFRAGPIAGSQAVGSTLFVVVNRGAEPAQFRFPASGEDFGGEWEPVLATAQPIGGGKSGARFDVSANAVAIWRFREDRCSRAGTS